MRLGCQAPLQALVLHVVISGPCELLGYLTRGRSWAEPSFHPLTSSKRPPSCSRGDNFFRPLQHGFISLGWDTGCRTSARGTLASQLSTFPPENCISRSRADTGKRQVSQTAHCDTRVPRVAGCRTLTLCGTSQANDTLPACCTWCQHPGATCPPGGPGQPKEGSSPSHTL